ncbi:hypothetical protein FOA52_006287, partial [Chlamydomonas sp. UWO 241]
MVPLLAVACTGLVLLATAVNFLVTAVIKFAQRLQSDLGAPIKVTLEDFASLSPPPAPSVFSPATKSLSIVVPAYNEEDRLAATLDETISYLQQRRNKQGPHFTYEIIVVDDGSKDGTVRVASKYVERHGFDAVRVLRVSKNCGKGHAVRRGMCIARGEALLLMDADGATRVSDLGLLEDALSKVQRASTAGEPPSPSPPTASSSAPLLPHSPPLLGCAFGSRAHLQRAAMARRSRLRNFLTQGFHACVTLVAGARIRDTQCGFKLFTRAAAATLFGNQRLQRWCFDVELLYLAEQLDIPVAEVPVHWTHTHTHTHSHTNTHTRTRTRTQLDIPVAE